LAAPTEIYPLSLHDALPIFRPRDPDPPDQFIAQTRRAENTQKTVCDTQFRCHASILPVFIFPVRHSHGRNGSYIALSPPRRGARSEEHTSELQSRENLVCRL